MRPRAVRGRLDRDLTPEEWEQYLKDHVGDVLLSSVTRETIEGFQARRSIDGVSNRTINMDVGALQKLRKRPASTSAPNAISGAVRLRCWSSGRGTVSCGETSL